MKEINLTELQIDRFWAKVDKSGECWNWTGYKARGYGSMAYTQNRKFGRILTHRVSYTLAYGPIPEGKVIDHLCHNPSCVRPEHLRATTPKRNNENRKGPNKGSVSGIRGVSWDKQAERWLVQVGHNRRVYKGGTFKDKEMAAAAAKELRARLYGEQAA